MLQSSIISEGAIFLATMLLNLNMANKEYKILQRREIVSKVNKKWFTEDATNEEQIYKLLFHPNSLTNRKEVKS